MILWYIFLILFAFISFAVDVDLAYLPQEVFRPIWNAVVLGFSIYLLVRMRSKIKVGAYESMQKEYQNLTHKLEENRFVKMARKVRELEERILHLEGKK